MLSQRCHLFALHSFTLNNISMLAGGMFGFPNMLQARMSGFSDRLPGLGCQSETAHLLPQRGARYAEDAGSLDHVATRFLQRHFYLPPLRIVTSL